MNFKPLKRLIDAWRGNLKDFAALEMLPTPSTRDYKGMNNLENTKKKIAKGERAHMGQLPNYIGVKTGKTSQLNPRFVAEMMGFPPNWTELPFQQKKVHEHLPQNNPGHGGAKNPSKPTETQ